MNQTLLESEARKDRQKMGETGGVEWKGEGVLQTLILIFALKMAINVAAITKIM